jgi:AraC-like DNA-binding protein
LNEALVLLNKDAGNVSEIAFETGFSSPSYFSKCFQKRYGVAPSDYLPGKFTQ